MEIPVRGQLPAMDRGSIMIVGGSCATSVCTNLRIPGGEIEPDLRAAAGAEHMGRTAAERRDQRRRVVGLLLDLQFLASPSKALRELPRGS